MDLYAGHQGGCVDCRRFIFRLGQTSLGRHERGRQVTRKLLEQTEIICLPGEAFGPGLEPYLRLVFGNIETDQLSELTQQREEL